ncbi:hypothetical protein WICPIJ_005412 [Wickerhamomyces pijperi]|uniref:Uncharacterized protein n=1 Tax=Wickerhamomyces pijperi TaxID=599730 RepID=A0A9P8TM09_WICPI|nr:hypothetical protein WICPIJ_005412 [Wickerhamomyces pijperi]
MADIPVLILLLPTLHETVTHEGATSTPSKTKSDSQAPSELPQVHLTSITSLSKGLHSQTTLLSKYQLTRIIDTLNKSLNFNASSILNHFSIFTNNWEFTSSISGLKLRSVISNDLESLERHRFHTGGCIRKGIHQSCETWDLQSQFRRYEQQTHNNINLKRLLSSFVDQGNYTATYWNSIFKNLFGMRVSFGLQAILKREKYHIGAILV